MPKKRDEWLCGYAAALGTINWLRDSPSLMQDALQSDGLTIEQLVAAGAAKIDLDRIGLRSKPQKKRKLKKAPKKKIRKPPVKTCGHRFDLRGYEVRYTSRGTPIRICPSCAE